MHKELMEILVCPVCKGELELKAESVEGDEVVQGSLVCHQCQESYPITDSIPNLLPPNLRG
ncbi:MAG: Trm112 family protein [SAR202 cluster bacterium]|nr:Trm112 family protein [SAR202 cluster bacterium]